VAFLIRYGNYYSARSLVEAEQRAATGRRVSYEELDRLVRLTGSGSRVGV